MDWSRFFSVIGIAIGALVAYRLLVLVIEHWYLFRGIMLAALTMWVAFGIFGLFDPLPLTFWEWLVGGSILFLGGGFAVFMFLLLMNWGVNRAGEIAERHEQRKEDVERLIKQHEKHHIPPPLNVVGQVVYEPPQKPKSAPKPKREPRRKDYSSRTKTFTNNYGQTIMDCGNGIFVKQTVDGVRVEQDGVTHYSGHNVDEAMEAVRKAYKQ